MSLQKPRPVVVGRALFPGSAYQNHARSQTVAGMVQFATSRGVAGAGPATFPLCYDPFPNLGITS